MGAVVIGPAAADVRRAVGPVAWCALEYLAASPPFGYGDQDTVAASVRSLAVGLGVSKNTAHRALAVLRAAGLVQPVQSRCGTGRFDAGCYRLAVPHRLSPRVSRWASARHSAAPASVSGSASRPLRLPEPCRSRVGLGRAVRGRVAVSSSCRCCRGSEVVILVVRFGFLVVSGRQVPADGLGCQIGCRVRRCCG